MTDLEMIKRCAEKMGGEVKHDLPRGHKGDGWIRLDGAMFDPLHDDEQAMALVKKFGLTIYGPRKDIDWRVGTPSIDTTESPDLNRAIVECVAGIVL